ncbi:GMC oxidoreductase [Trametes meyenii]|nr:GMC oxidoreductase [Trametes meyenii]
MGASHSQSIGGGGLGGAPASFATAVGSIGNNTETDPPPNGRTSGGSSTLTPWRSYDYVIVGGGSAGCVLAARLSENPNNSVLLLEAGQSHRGDLPFRIPFGFSKASRRVADWQSHTTPQAGLQGRAAYMPRGKILGGSSATSALVYERCPPEDFNQWVSMGAAGWSYNDLEPYFKKSEHYIASPQHPNVDLDVHGTDGPWPTSYSAEVAPIDRYVVNACKSLGLPFNQDISTAQSPLGVTRFIGNIDSKGERSSTATAYIPSDVLARPNLTIAIGITVERIMFDQPSGVKPRARRVLLRNAGDAPLYGITAAREVILCAGAIGTPQLLLLSGVGPTEELNKHNIPVVCPLPAVGRNLSDHVSTGPIPFRAQSDLTYDFLRSKFSGLWAELKWRVFGTGPFSSMMWSSGAFVRSTDPRLPFSRAGEPPPPVNDLTSGSGAPDIELVWAPMAVFDEEFGKPPSDVSGVTLAAIALRPQSKGSVTLQSRSVWDAPLINPNLLAAESDINVLIRATRLVLRVARTEPLSSVLHPKPRAAKKDSPWWLCDVDPDKVTDKELEERLRASATSAWQPTGTARIGASPETSVVDAQLRVHGVDGLRVVDASVFPTSLSGHQCATVVAVAEKAADMLKQSAA